MLLRTEELILVLVTQWYGTTTCVQNIHKSNDIKSNSVGVYRAATTTTTTTTTKSDMLIFATLLSSLHTLDQKYFCSNETKKQSNFSINTALTQSDPSKI